MDILPETFRDIGDQMYVYSAFLDRRVNTVRMFGMSKFNYSTDPIKCLLWYADQEEPDTAIIEFVPWDKR